MATRMLEVIYTASPNAAVKALVTPIHKSIRVVEKGETGWNMVFVDADFCHQDITNEVRVLMGKVFGILSENDMAPIPQVTHIGERHPVVIDHQGMVAFQYPSKHHAEHLSFNNPANATRKEFLLSFTVPHRSGINTVRVTDVYLTGPHRAVRSVKRYIANALSNNTVLDYGNLARIQQLAGYSVQVYFLLETGFLMDVVNARIVERRYYTQCEWSRVFDNTQLVLTGKTTKPFNAVNKWDTLLNSVNH